MELKKNKPLIFDTYLAVIKNSVGSKSFKNFYAEVDGKKVDILKNGDLSCAYFVSSILYLFKLINFPHCTVSGTVKDIENFGWEKIKSPRAGAVIVWESSSGFKDGEAHKHIGFYIGNDKAVSNSSKLGHPVIHDLYFGHNKKGEPERDIEAFYWSDKIK